MPSLLTKFFKGAAANSFVHGSAETMIHMFNPKNFAFYTMVKTNIFVGVLVNKVLLDHLLFKDSTPEVLGRYAAIMLSNISICLQCGKYDVDPSIAFVLTGATLTSLSTLLWKLSEAYDVRIDLAAQPSVTIINEDEDDPALGIRFKAR